MTIAPCVWCVCVCTQEAHQDKQINRCVYPQWLGYPLPPPPPHYLYTHRNMHRQGCLRQTVSTDKLCQSLVANAYSMTAFPQWLPTMKAESVPGSKSIPLHSSSSPQASQECLQTGSPQHGPGASSYIEERSLTFFNSTGGLCHHFYGLSRTRGRLG